MGAGEMERENYRLHIKYRESKNINGWISDTDTVTFSDKWELEKYISGENAYNELDDAMKKRDDEILLYAENGKGEVVWRSEIMLAIQSVKDYLKREFGNERQQDFKNLSNIGVAVRDYYMVAGYWGKWLVAIDENNHYFVAEDTLHLYEIGTVCDSDMQLIPAEQLPEAQYKEFIDEFGRE